MKSLTGLLLCLFCVFAVRAQQYIIKGSVADTLNVAALPRASITVVRTSDSVIESYARTRTDGKFQLAVPATGKYIIQITFPSFADYVDVINVKDPVTDLGQIALLSKEHLLQEVVFTKQIGAIKIKGDTTEYVADSFKVKENANVEALLKKLPGISVDKNGQITAQGETVQKILVDGEEFFSDDPKVVTQGLQANAVSKVQVFDKKSDQAEFTGVDDGEKTRTINLELKEDKKKGYFGKVDVGGGTGGYFQNQLMLSAFKGKRQIAAFGIVSNTDKVGLGWSDNEKFGGGNGTFEMGDDGSYYMMSGSMDDFGGWDGQYRGSGLPKAWTGGIHFADKWNKDMYHVSGNYRYALQNVEIDGSNTRQTALTGDTTRMNTEHKNQFNKSERHGLDMLYEWKIDTNTSIRLTANGSQKHSETYTHYHTETWNRTTEDGAKTINERTLTNATDAQSFTGDLLFRKKFAKKGRTISLDFKENYKNSKGNGLLYSETTTPTPGIPFNTIVDQKKVSNSLTSTFSTKAVYTEPISKKSNLEFNAGLSSNNSDALNSSYNRPTGGGDYTDLQDSFSSNYRYDIRSTSGGASYKFTAKNMNFLVGSDVSNSDYLQTDMLHGDTSRSYNYTNIFPKANFTYKIKKQTSVSLYYNGSTKQPTIWQIAPQNQNTDPLNVTLGNPHLLQEFNNRISARFNDYKVLKHRYIYANASYTTTQDAIVASQKIIGPVSTTQYVNVNGNYSASGYVGYGFKIEKLNLNTGVTLNGSANHVNNFVNGLKNASDNTSISIEPNFRYEIEDKIDISLNPEIAFNDNHSTINVYSTKYKVFTCNFDISLELPKKLDIGTNVDAMVREKTIAFPTNNQVIKWNAYVSKKFLKKDELELRATVYDILNQNLGFTRTAQGNTITQDSYNTIRRYGMLSLIWNITHTPGAAASTEEK